MSKKKSRSYFAFSVNSLLNRYCLVLFLFFGWMLFIDKYRISNSLKLNKTIAKLSASKIEYEQKIAQAHIAKKELEENSEKVAREKFFMHKDNEEVFIIEKSKK